jgi:hypothetical protein
MDSSGSGWPVAGSCEHGDELLGSTNGEEVLTQVSDYQLMSKGSGQWRQFSKS